MDNFVYVIGSKEFSDFQDDLINAENIYIDTESSDLDFFTAKWLLFQVEVNNKTYVFDCTKLKSHELRYIVQLIKDSEKTVVGFNLKYDLSVIYHNSRELLTNVFDIMVAEVLIFQGINKNPYPSLAEVVWKYERVELDKDIREMFYGAEEVNQEMILYSAMDVKYLKSLKEQQEELIAQSKQERILKMEMELLPVVTMMQYDGVKLNVEQWREIEKHNVKEAEKSREKLLQIIVSSVEFSKFKNGYDCAEKLSIPVKTKKLRSLLESLVDAETISPWIVDNFNVNSPQQIKNFINNFLGIKVDSTGEKTIIKHVEDHEFIGELLNYRGFSKLVSTYGESFLKHINSSTGNIHTDFNQVGTATGRFSSSGPNLQNIKADEDDTPVELSFRTAFVPDSDEYVFVTADYSQMELRLMAAISGDPEMSKAFIRGEDIHKRTAAFLFEKEAEDITPHERKGGKTMNFAVGYGTSPYGLYYNFGVPVDTAEDWIYKFFKGYKVLNSFITEVQNVIWKKKYSITPMGRRRYFEDFKFFTGGAKEAYKYEAQVKREGFNHIIQGGSADILKTAMVEIFYNMPFNSDEFKQKLQVHDELVIQVRKSIAEEAKKYIVKIMEAAFQPYLGEIPAKVDAKIAPYWSK